jgi:cyclic-di-AMP phosphodiesterase PgpH
MQEQMMNRQDILQRRLNRGLYVLLVVLFIVSGAAIIAFDTLKPSDSKLALEVGQAAPRDVLAPRSLQYESDVLLKSKREGEVAAVRPVYDPPDKSIGSERAQLARQVLDYIENVRYDDFATREQKRADLEAITALSLSRPVIDAILNIDDNEKWRDIDRQIIRLLERVMAGEVREDNIQSIKDTLPNLISATYNETEVKIIQEIVGDLMRANTFYNEELTRQQQIKAAEGVPAEMRTFVKGQMIIREGEIATEAHIEALDRFGLLEVKERKTAHFAGGLVAMVLLTAMLGAYIYKFYPDIITNSSFMILLGLLFLLFLGAAQIVDSNDAIQPYFFPGAALAFLVATLVGSQLAIVMNMVLAGLAGYMTGSSLEFGVIIGFSGTLGVLALGRTERINAYFVAGGVVCVASAMIAGLFALGADSSVDFFTVFLQVMGAVVNGTFSAAVALVGLYVISNVMNIPTSLKIVELLQPNHPLLQRLLREAPGTYQHSLQVANLAELGAEQIDANASLLRAAAMYHDVGKILNPHFFVENQADGVNSHEALDDPMQSARIIIGHATEGARLARRYRLPARIREFIMEHHGTTQVMYFYKQAQEQAEQMGETVDMEDFTYPGPRPSSRETAILMLADGCESSVRARRPQSREDIQETVDYIFEARLQSGQLDDSGLTLSDLRALRDTFLAALQGVFHPRIAYPGTPGQDALAAGAGELAQLQAGEQPGTDTPATEAARSFGGVMAAIVPSDSSTDTAESGPDASDTDEPPATVAAAASDGDTPPAGATDEAPAQDTEPDDSAADEKGATSLATAEGQAEHAETQAEAEEEEQEEQDRSPEV